jgi:hypothetical protein
LSDAAPESAPDLDVHEVDDGLVIYDLTSERVHYLNGTAALVFSLCTGEHDDAGIIDLVRVAFKLAQAPSAEVQGCLAQLRSEGLIR